MTILKIMNLLKLILISAMVTTTVSSCSSNIPLDISQEVQGAPSFTQIQKQPDAYQDQLLRWGGTILKTDNKQGSSWVTIVAFPLSNNGRPMESDRSPGRFIAIIDEFLEPLVFTRDREITVRGRLVKTETIKVGDFPYQYPLLQVDSYHLWAPKPEINEMNSPHLWPYSWPYYPYYPDPYFNRRLYD
jgi:outer membrane lipoprotein